MWHIPLSVVWILTIINAYNLVDVMDGLATVLAIGATFSFCCIAAAGAAHFDVLILLLAFLGPLCAFFMYNKPPAAMYLGDTGSLFIGGFLSCVPFLFNWNLHNPYGLFAPIIILAVPLLEVGMLILIRTYKGIPFYQGSPHHFSMYLQKKGFSKWQIVRHMFAINLLLLLGASLLVFTKVPFVFMIIFCIFFFLAWVYTIFFYN